MLKGNFELADILHNSGLCDKYYTNGDGEDVYAIAKKFGIKHV